MVSVRTRTLLLLLVAAAAVMAAGCRGVLKPEYEYEEDLDLSLDGSATLNVNASVAALVALRGVDLDVDPRARIDRDRVRALFAGPGVEVRRVSLSRRDGRRFVHVGLEVEDVRRLSQVPRFAWSAYRFDRRGEVMEFRQAVGAAAGAAVGDVGWTGDEMVSFRLHLPSVVPFHNSPGGLERGNIVTWEQPLSERLQGTPLVLQVNMEPESILYSTLLLFGSTIVAAAIVFALVIWLVARRGRAAAAGSRL